MKKSLPLIVAGVVVAAAGQFAAGPAAAQASFTAAGSGSTCDPQKGLSNPPNSFGSETCSSNGVTVTLTAWGFTGSSTVPTTKSTGFTQANLGDFNTNGFGAYSGTKESSSSGSQHAFDNVTSNCGSSTDSSKYTGSTTSGGGTAAVNVSTNNSGCGGAIEALLMSFDQKVAISKISTGYVSTDGDLSIYVWSGAGAPTMASQTLANNASTGLDGWTLVGSHDMGGTSGDGGSNPYNIALNDASLYSSYFLVATYFGATTTGADGSKLDYGNDRFKISGWTANVCSQTLLGPGSAQTCGTTTTNQTPEPASLALATVALVGIGVAGRRRRR